MNAASGVPTQKQKQEPNSLPERAEQRRRRVGGGTRRP